MWMISKCSNFPQYCRYCQYFGANLIKLLELSLLYDNVEATAIIYVIEMLWSYLIISARPGKLTKNSRIFMILLNI